MTAPDDRVEAATQKCLADCRPSDRPYSQLEQFMESLRADPTWGHMELLAVESRVIQALEQEKAFRSPYLKSDAQNRS
jgi:hypothetical protein